MRREAFVVLLALFAPGRLMAGSYFQQASFNLPASTLARMDADAVGNLYLLGMAPGTTTYQVTGEATQALTPQFSFDTGLSSPSAFAVEPSGVIDVLDSKNGFSLMRYTNPGTFVSSASYFVSYAAPNMVATAIDKINQRVYIAYQYTYHPLYLMCLGCGGPSSVTKTTINQYDFKGNSLLSFSMPGADYAAGSCYTPTAAAVDPQGNLYIADGLCQQVLKFSPTGSLTTSTPATSWSYSFNPRGLWTDPASNLYISQSVCGPSGCRPGIVKLNSGLSFVTSLTADSAAGCAWDSRILYTSSSGSQPLLRFVSDGPPSVPAESAPFGMVVQHSSAAALSWQASSDPEGDPVTYTAYLGTTPTQLSPIGSTTQAGFATQPLTFGVTYYWQIVAQDSYLGLPLQQTPAPVESFNLNLTNQPPGAFGVVSGAGTAVTRATSATLAWQPAVDPDGDPVVYDVLWQAPGQSAWTLVGTTAQTSWPMSGLSFGATYYWSARARDVYNAATMLAGGAPQFYNPVFKDTPPPAPAIVSGSGAIAQHTFSPQATLAWSSVADADGDSVAYRLFLGTNAQALSLVQDSTATTFDLSGSLGTTYYWQVVAYDPYAATPTPVQTSRFVLQDSPPSPVVYLTTATSYAQHTTSPVLGLSWAPSTDPDGDAVSYRLDVQTSTGAWPSVALGGATSIALNALLETTYYWRVMALDAYGGASTGSWMSFIVHLANRPPYPIIYTSPATVTTRATRAALTWQNTGDPDGDPTSYALFLSTNPSAQFLVQQGTATSYALNFQFGTTYYWSVAATDTFGAQTPGPLQTFLPIFQDTPPPAPAIVSGSGTIGEHALRPSATLAWSSVVDADGDPVSYRLAVGTNPAALSVVQDSQSLSYNLPTPLFGTTYYWQVTAYDPYAATPSQVQSLSLYLQNSPPQSFAVLTGTGTVTTRATSQALSWQNAIDPDGDVVTYDVAVSTASGAWATVQSSTATSFTLATQFGATYYWQVTARDGFGGATPSGIQALLVTFWNPAPTVPLNQSKTGTIPYHGFSPTESFFWQPATDPAGDPITYSLAYGTDSSHMSVSTGVPLGLTLPVPLNTAFYYSIVATGLYGAASPSPVNWVFYQFTNNPPGPFSVVGATGTVVTRQTSAALSWTASVDPDGDPVSYSVFAGTSPATLSLVANTTRNSAALSNLAFGTTCYWRVDAYDGLGGTTTANEGTQSLYYQFYDPFPSPVVYLSTATSYSQHTTAPVVPLSWTPSSNAAGDPISYRLDVQTSSGAQTSFAMGFSSTTLTIPVVFGATYTWRVAALDPFGGASTGSWSSFSMSFLDAPPPAPVPTVGAGTLLEHALAPAAQLAWSAVQSPYGDPVGYQLRVGTSSSSLSAVSLSSQTAFDLPAPLFGTTYYWQISAADPYGAASTSPVQSLLLIFQNNPPAGFSATAGTGTLTTRATSTVLSWAPAIDPDGDSVTYAVSVGTAPGAMSIVQRSQARSYTLGLRFGATYYWAVSAFDGFGGTTTVAGGLQSLLPVFQNDPPSQVNVVSPFTQSPVVKTMRNSITATWDQVSDPQGDPITYTVYFSDSPQDMAPLATVGPAGQAGISALALRPLQVTPQSAVTTDSTTVTLTLTSLDYYKTYYLRVAASNPFGATTTTPTSIFTLASPDGFPKAYNYPNPFNPNRGGTNIVFNAPPSGYAQATVEVYSEWQALLFKQDYYNIRPGISQVHFDGRDRSGRPLFNGSYICRVRFSGPADKQIFYLLVVK